MRISARPRAEQHHTFEAIAVKLIEGSPEASEDRIRKQGFGHGAHDQRFDANTGQCWQISSTIREIRPYIPRVDGRQVLAGARTTDIEQVALSFLDDPPGVISIRTGERFVQRYVRGTLADQGLQPNSRSLATRIGP